MTDPREVVRRYFACMRAGDPAVVELFHEDARLVGLGDDKRGREAITAFYRGVIERAGPSPELVGDLLGDGARVAAEIRITLQDGNAIHAVDLFEIDSERIRQLTYFLANGGRG